MNSHRAKQGSISSLDRDALVDFFNHRLDARDRGDVAMSAYWAGRIDGHCLQNAIDDWELQALAAHEGFRVDWNTAMGAA